MFGSSHSFTFTPRAPPYTGKYTLFIPLNVAGESFPLREAMNGVFTQTLPLMCVTIAVGERLCELGGQQKHIF